MSKKMWIKRFRTGGCPRYCKATRVHLLEAPLHVESCGNHLINLGGSLGHVMGSLTGCKTKSKSV